jgi:hypothetical protein
MKKRDARKLAQQTQYELKRTCVKLIKSGMTQTGRSPRLLTLRGKRLTAGGKLILIVDLTD